MKNDTHAYALSNNHVYARMNQASIGEEIDQPGVFDTHCLQDSNNQLGRLASFKPITFDPNTINTIDAALAEVNYDPDVLRTLEKSTPADGYGTPKSEIVAPALDGAVQKYGRTSALTKGTIAGVNAEIDIDYGSAGTARFVGQIIVFSGKPFIKAGDSGSLLVTDAEDPSLDRHPVGLLFAGSLSGKYAIANPIGVVLAEFGVTIDGE